MVFVSAFENQAILGSQDVRRGWTLGYQWTRPTRSVNALGFRVIQVWEVNAFHSRGGYLRREPANETFGAAALFLWRFEQASETGSGLYLEIGWGLQWANRRTWDLDSQLNSTPTATLGYFFPSYNKTIDLGVRFYHISNAGANLPNQGQNQVQLRLGVRF